MGRLSTRPWLSIILLLAGLVFLIPAMIYPDNLSFIAARFIVSCFAYGWIGAKIGSQWIDEAATT